MADAAMRAYLTRLHGLLELGDCATTSIDVLESRASSVHGFAVHAGRLCIDMCVDICADMCVDMFAGVCADVRADMRVDMCEDMCVEMGGRCKKKRRVYRHVHRPCA